MSFGLFFLESFLIKTRPAIKKCVAGIAFDMHVENEMTLHANKASTMYKRATPYSQRFSVEFQQHQLI